MGVFYLNMPIQTVGQGNQPNAGLRRAVILGFSSVRRSLSCDQNFDYDLIKLGNLGITFVNPLTLHVNEDKIDEDHQSGWARLRNQMWNLFESPESGNMARFVSLISVTAIIASTTIFCLETMPAFKEGTEECRNVVHLCWDSWPPYIVSMYWTRLFLLSYRAILFAILLCIQGW